MHKQTIIISLLLVVLSLIDALKLRIIPSRRPRLRRPSILPRSYRQLDLPEEDARLRTGVQPWPTEVSTTKRTTISRRPFKVTKPFKVVQNNFLRESTTRTTDQNNSSKNKKKTDKPILSNVHELRNNVLDKNIPLKNLQVYLNVQNVTTPQLLNHDVIQLISKRYMTQSKPGARTDNEILALSMEGGGMRGAVSAGMAAAIASLGLTDTFDKIYGSSAGSVIGAYMVSRQMCMDVYVDILPAAKQTFVCVKRMCSALAVTAFDYAISQFKTTKNKNFPKLSHNTLPGMNISFVLDGIMHETHGIRPLDIERFKLNNAKQNLRVASSYVKNGKLYTKCFGTEHFFPEHTDDHVQRADGTREGLYACLEASMTVPGATGPPVPILDTKSKNDTLAFFDAFCFEPLPYRSAVEEGATHVLVLCSRPEGFQPKTAPGLYERGVAPLYFRSHGQPEVAEFFEQGGQQYIYAEDLLTLEEGKQAGIRGERVHVPPPKILYGVQRDEETERIASNRNEWKQAHLLPLKVPIGTPELPTLEQDREEVAKAVRGGFAAAFDLLAPVIGLKIDDEFNGAEVANMVFPTDDELDYEYVLENQLRVNGDLIPDPPVIDSNIPLQEPTSQIPRRRRKRDIVFRVFGARRRRRLRMEQLQAEKEQQQQQEQQTISTSQSSRPVIDYEKLVNPEQLLNILPGFESGQMAHLASALYRQQ